MASSSVGSWVVGGVLMNNGACNNWCKANFNMPVPCLFTGAFTCSDGWTSSRSWDIGGGSYSLSALGFQPGFEVAVQDAVYRWDTNVGEGVCGRACIYICWFRGATNLVNNYNLVTVNMGPTPCYWYWSFQQKMYNQGIAGWEICGPVCTYCTVVGAKYYSGCTAVCIPPCTTCFDLEAPATTQCSASLIGSIWVDSVSNNLNYINNNRWQQYMVGTDLGATLATPGSLWIDNSCYLHWIGSDMHDYRASWRVCQFCSTFSNGAPVNPAPGASYAGRIWMDSQFGGTHLAYIGCDGNKYLTGGGCYPY